MGPTDCENPSLFRESFHIPPEAIDANGHVNNVAYVQWMQDLAVKHWRALGGMEINQELGGTWVARSHRIEYLRPAYEDEAVEGLTWVTSIGRVRSKRKYAFLRTRNKQVLARGETDWVFVEAETGRPLAIPRSINGILPIIDDPV